MTLGIRSFSPKQTVGSINIVAHWTHALNDGKNLDNVLVEFQKLFSARAVQVVRQMRNFDRLRMVARQEASSGKLFERPTRSFVPALLGDLLHRTNLGSLFLSSEMQPDSAAQESLDQFGLKGVGVIALSNETEFSDFLEFHFERPLLNHNRQLLEILGLVLSQSWRSRSSGVVANLIAGHPFPAASEPRSKFTNILSSNNPAGLTRSEFRVCMLVQEGSLPEDLAEMLHVSTSTFRSHLRAIYFKTGVSGHVELVHLLHRTGMKPDELNQRGG